MTSEVKIWPAKLAIAVLIITIFPWQYAVYMVGKFIVFIVAVYYCYNSYQRNSEKQGAYFWYFLIALILYNPIIPIHLFLRMFWIIVDVLFIAFLVKYIKDFNAGITQSSVVSTIFCSECGVKNDSVSNYCLNCGQQLSN